MSSELIMMPQRGDLAKADGYTSLPPREFWLEDLDKLRIESPVDERGLVDIHQVVDIGKSLIDPDYEWPRNLSVHHLYWNKRWYGFPMAGSDAMIFRELPVHKILVPRVFENMLHRVMVQPDIPDQEVMKYRIESWDVAKRLFWTVRTIIRLEKMVDRYTTIGNGGLPIGYRAEDMIGREVLAGAMLRHFSDVEVHMDRLHAVPSDFRLVEPRSDIMSCSSERQRYAKQLGGVVLAEAVPKTRELNAV